MSILAVFRSRSQSLDFAERLNGYGIAAETVAAPKEAKIGCGLCVRFEEKNFPRVRAILKIGKYTTFKGFYKMDFSLGKQIVFPYGK
ncbi:MAG: DUF3343 domain-containing protein [Clostridia bacterium]|nr:DUF3343 domain-containing protein [Clostridia bacterium]